MPMDAFCVVYRQFLNFSKNLSIFFSDSFLLPSKLPLSVYALVVRQTVVLMKPSYEI